MMQIVYAAIEYCMLIVVKINIVWFIIINSKLLCGGLPVLLVLLLILKQ